LVRQFKKKKAIK